MRYFLDTEFIVREPGSGWIQDLPSLVSIGIVAEDGREYYAETVEAVTLQGADEWFRQNVAPQLICQIDDRPWREKFSSRIFKTPEELKTELVDFIGFDRAEFWGYYCAHDWVITTQLFGRLLDIPENWLKNCMDLKQFAHSLAVRKREFPVQTEEKHNALNDARWNKEVYAFLADRARLHGLPGF